MIQRILSLLVVVLLLCGCTVPLERARVAGRPPNLGAPATPEERAYCRKLDSARTTWSAVAKGSAALAGVSGLGAVPIEDPDAQLAVGVTSAVLGATALVATYVAEQKGSAWARECSK